MCCDADVDRRPRRSRRENLSPLDDHVAIPPARSNGDRDAMHDLDAGMRPGAAIVNVCRGSVVDEEAIADALEEGLLSGYAADVFAMEDWAEPTRPHSIPERLLRHPATLFTPHLGTAVDDVRLQMSPAAAHQAEQAPAGERPEPRTQRRPLRQRRPMPERAAAALGGRLPYRDDRCVSGPLPGQVPTVHRGFNREPHGFEARRTR
jgi:hypothetical protein